jgi:uncharacterized protein YdaU (DUF1376 family)
VAKSPAFQFYPAEYLADAGVQMMTLEEEGAYIRLLCYCWREGSIPNDDRKLSLLCKGAVTTVIAVVTALFENDPNDPSRLVHGRLEKEREKQQQWSEKSSEGGKKSALKRWGKKTSRKLRVVTKCSPNDANQKVTLQSLFSSSYIPLNPLREVVVEVAARLLKQHPPLRRNIGLKGTCGLLTKILKYKRLSGTAAVEHLRSIGDRHQAQCSTDQWRKDGGQFAKELANWLAPSMERYDQEPPAVIAEDRTERPGFTPEQLLA